MGSKTANPNKESSAEPVAEAVQNPTEPVKTYTEAEYKALQKELDTLRMEHLSQEERTRLELTQRENDVANREAIIRDKENRLHAIQALEQAQLVGNGITSADLIPFVMDNTASGIDRKVKALTALLDKRAKAETDRIYKNAGRQPQQVRNENTGVNGTSYRPSHAAQQTKAKEIREHYTGGKV